MHWTRYRSIASKLAVINMKYAKIATSFLAWYISLNNVLSYYIYSKWPQKYLGFGLVPNSGLSFSLREYCWSRKQKYLLFGGHGFAWLNRLFVFCLFWLSQRLCLFVWSGCPYLGLRLDLESLRYFLAELFQVDREH